MTALDEIKRLAQKEFPLFIKYICDGLTGALVQNTHFFPMPVRVNFAKEAENPEEKAEISDEYLKKLIKAEQQVFDAKEDDQASVDEKQKEEADKWNKNVGSKIDVKRVFPEMIEL